jgi:hypothetical protein
MHAAASSPCCSHLVGHSHHHFCSLPPNTLAPVRVVVDLPDGEGVSHPSLDALRIALWAHARDGGLTVFRDWKNCAAECLLRPRAHPPWLCLYFFPQGVSMDKTFKVVIKYAAT